MKSNTLSLAIAMAVSFSVNVHASEDVGPSKSVYKIASCSLVNGKFTESIYLVQTSDNSSNSQDNQLGIALRTDSESIGNTLSVSREKNETLGEFYRISVGESSMNLELKKGEQIVNWRGRQFSCTMNL